MKMENANYVKISKINDMNSCTTINLCTLKKIKIYITDNNFYNLFTVIDERKKIVDFSAMDVMRIFMAEFYFDEPLTMRTLLNKVAWYSKYSY